MYLANFKVVASGVDSLVAQNYIDMSKVSYIKTSDSTVIIYVRGLDGPGGLAADSVTITMQGTTAEKQANVDIVAAELARMVNRSVHVGHQHSNKFEVIGNGFMNTKATVSSATVTGIVTIGTVVAVA